MEKSNTNWNTPDMVLQAMQAKRGNKKAYKTEQVLRHMLQRKRGITPMIYELRHNYGLRIITKMETRNGETYARYYLPRG